MRRGISLIKVALFCVCSLAISINVLAQSKKKSRSGSAYDNSSSTYDVAPKKQSHVPAADTTELPNNSGYNTSASGDTSGLMKNLPIEVIKDSTDGGLLEGQKKSLRKDNVFVDNLVDSTATPLPYSPLYASDALYRVRVWRTIDTRDKANLPYFYNTAIDGEGNTHLIDIIINAMKKDSVQAFSAIDDRFTTPITFQQALATFGSGTDTSASYDLNGNIVGYQVRQKAIAMDSIYKYRIKEEWVFNRRDGKTYVRILGIAPLITYTLSNGEMMGNSEHPAFWIYYPDLRTNLVRSIIANPMDGGGTITWEQIFENRLFDSQIIKSSLDAEHGFTKTPLDAEQAKTIQTELENLGDKIGAPSTSTNN